MVAGAAYDGWADWYEAYLQHDGYRVAAETLADLLGSGDGRCLDYGCGVGHQVPMLESLGWTVFGFDLSADMLRRARTVVRASRSPTPARSRSPTNGSRR